MTELDLTQKSSFTHWCEDKIRFADLDVYGHLNNVAYATFAESGRVDFLSAVLPGSLDGRDEGWVIAKLTVNFLASAYYPGKVKIGNVVRRLGKSSLALDQGLFVNGKCFSTIESVLVWADSKNERSRPMPEAIKEVLEPYLRE